MSDVLSLLEATPDQIFIETESSTVTYSQALTRIKAIIKILSDSGVKTVAIFADNNPDWILLDLACQAIGLCCIPLPLFFSDEQLRHAISVADVDIIFSDQHERISNLTPLTSNANIDINQLHAYKVKQFLKIDKPKKTEKITFTSGSTGSPKGVCLTTEQQWSVARSLADSVKIKQTRHLCVLPLSTLLENIAGVYAPMLVGGTIILTAMKNIGFNGSADFQLEKLLNTIKQTQPDSLVLLPQLLLALVNAIEAGWKIPASVKFIAVGGGKVAPNLIKRAQKYYLPVYEGYGLSEGASVVSLNTQYKNRLGSVGRPLPHLNIEIKNQEIFITKQTFLGYLNEPDSWYQNTIATGDIGHLDADGFLYIDGRKKNILISSYGRNINPEWLESELLCHPLIQQCVVIGDDKPFCGAILYPKKTNLDDAVIQNLIDQTNQHLPDYAHIKTWLRLNKPLSSDDGLLTENGKPKRNNINECYKNEIRQMYQTTAPLVKEKYA